ncbi:hypothetical protein V6N11_079969 [Hibiscus sabdariffa]|uniref:CCHC-type domain-containing protein n=1 Tax=Hibiscus sabdariffa TaxID=183260 RepID=A0ABR2RWW8_9ROSI
MWPMNLPLSVPLYLIMNLLLKYSVAWDPSMIIYQLSFKLETLQSLLLTHRENIKSLFPITVIVAQRSSSGHNAFRNNRNNPWRSQNSRPQHLQQRQPGNTQRNPQRNRVTCQLCGRPGHTTNVCRSCSHNHIEAQAHYASMPWIIDSKASHHVTTDANNIQHPHDYTGTYEITVDNVPLPPPLSTKVSPSSQMSSTSPPLQYSDPSYPHPESTDHSLPSQPVSPLSTSLPTPPPIDVAPQPPLVHRPITRS